MDLVPITYRQLDHWCRRRYVGGGGNGTGHHRVFSASEVLLVACLAGAAQCGMRINSALANRLAEADLFQKQSVEFRGQMGFNSVHLEWDPAKLITKLEELGQTTPSE